MNPEQAKAKEAQVVEFALYLNRVTPDAVDAEIAVLGALSFLCCVARAEGPLVDRVASLLIRAAYELVQSPEAAPPGSPPIPPINPAH